MTKLVRDNIPRILKKKGENPAYHVAEGDDYWEYLLDKLQEEVYDFIEHPIEEELADIIEVIETIKKERFPKVEHTVERKRKEKGAFTKRYILE